jgi:phosphoserine aminotransferase
MSEKTFAAKANMTKPNDKPKNPCFSSGPCAKRPGWSFDALKGALTGRSHRSGPGKKKLAEIIDRHRKLLGIPADYMIGIVPASDTGAIEMAMWSMLGERGVDILAWEAFSTDWLKDVTKQLKLKGGEHLAPYGELPDLSKVNFDNDVVFVWNGTTSGVRVPDGDWIPSDRKGLTFCDATSAVFGYEMPWDKLDVTTWSWQKVIGGEAGHGMLVLSPRAVARLESYKPAWPLPKIFRMTKDGKLNKDIFQGLTINTPSMIAVEDCLDALNWVEKCGGAAATIKCTQANYAAVKNWVDKTGWVDFLPKEEKIRSTTSICLVLTEDWFTSLSDAAQQEAIGEICKKLESEKVAYDIKSYRDAPAGLRIWAGATVEASDIEALFPWLEWAYAETREAALKKAA